MVGNMSVSRVHRNIIPKKDDSEDSEEEVQTAE
jgi:hypothetical protein